MLRRRTIEKAFRGKIQDAFDRDFANRIKPPLTATTIEESLLPIRARTADSDRELTEELNASIERFAERMGRLLEKDSRDAAT